MKRNKGKLDGDRSRDSQWHATEHIWHNAEPSTCSGHDIDSLEVLHGAVSNNVVNDDDGLFRRLALFGRGDVEVQIAELLMAAL